MKLFLLSILVLHIVGGFTALLTGLIAMLTHKGGKNHRLAGKCYFWGMTGVFISAVILSIAHDKTFLLLVGFFSYYMVVRGYRCLYLKKLKISKNPGALDWFILIVAGGFILYFLVWGILALRIHNGFGWVAVVFATFGMSFLRKDLRTLLQGPAEKMHWWYTHIGGMGGGYIATATAFIVVNIQFSPGWVLWLIPTAVGVPIIMRTTAKYRRQFAAKAAWGFGQSKI